MLAVMLAAKVSRWLLMVFRAICRSIMGRKTRSISTESRGKSRTNKLIAVPPLRAKQSYRETKGIIRSNS
jgi:hypothetical protein